MADSRGAGFQVELPLTRMWKDDSGAMHFEGVASSTSRDGQRERMTPEAIAKMAQYRGIDLLPSHDAGPLEELGTIDETSADNEHFRVSGRLDDTNPDAARLFTKALAGKRYQLSVGGRVTSASWGVDEDGQRVRFIDDVELDHVAVCRPGRAANPDTYLHVMAKSVDGLYHTVTDVAQTSAPPNDRGVLGALRSWWPFAEKSGENGPKEAVLAQLEPQLGELCLVLQRNFML